VPNIAVTPRSKPDSSPPKNWPNDSQVRSSKSIRHINCVREVLCSGWKRAQLAQSDILPALAVFSGDNANALPKCGSGGSDWRNLHSPKSLLRQADLVNCGCPAGLAGAAGNCFQSFACWSPGFSWRPKRRRARRDKLGLGDVERRRKSAGIGNFLVGVLLLNSATISGGMICQIGKRRSFFEKSSRV
jgi:hypothetical protein